MLRNVICSNFFCPQLFLWASLRQSFGNIFEVSVILCHGYRHILALQFPWYTSKAIHYLVDVYISFAIAHWMEYLYFQALHVSLVTRIRTKDVFKLIHQHNLFSAVGDKILLLMDFDEERAVKLFLDHTDAIPVSCHYFQFLSIFSLL